MIRGDKPYISIRQIASLLKIEFERTNVHDLRDK